ncbi:MAG: hypothetical protein D6681_19880, partial [Calditrichaeota bacterium]
NWHRYYNPHWGRYLSPDPVPSLQPFAYAKNNPVKFVDPSGLFWDYVADGVGLGYDIYVIKTEGASFKNVATFLVDVVLAAAPFIPSIGGLKALGKTASHGDEVVKLGKAASHGDEIVKGAKKVVPKGGVSGFRGSKGFELKNAPYQPVRNTATEIGERRFSGHALDQMQNRGIMPSIVDNTIKTGITFPTKPGTIGYFDPVNNIRIITNAENGTVITVIRGVP